MGWSGTVGQVATHPPQVQDWNYDRGSWHVHILPYMEQTALYNRINAQGGANSLAGQYNLPPLGPNESGGPVGQYFSRSVNAANRIGLPYGRCPSDDYDPAATVSNYVGSLGPQCLAGPCGFDPFGIWCRPEASGAGGGVPGMGYEWSPDHGNAWEGFHIRGAFNRLGAKISFPAGFKDGTSNTIMIGEALPAQHDHLVGNQWWGYNNGSSHCGTNVPINYDSSASSTWCSPADKYRGNWSVSWGFKSNHSGGSQFAFGDGSVQFVSQSIDMAVYQRLGCRNDGRPVGNWQ